MAARRGRAGVGGGEALLWGREDWGLHWLWRWSRCVNGDSFHLNVSFDMW